MLFWRKTVITFFLLSALSNSHASQCVELLNKASNTNVTSIFTSKRSSLTRYANLKRHSMWNHSQAQFHQRIVDEFIRYTEEESAQTLHQIIIDLNESDKIYLLHEAVEILSSDTPNLSEFNSVYSALLRHEIVLDFKLDNSPRLRRLVLGSQIALRDVSQIRDLLESLAQEKDVLVNLFELVAQNADETIRTARFEDPSVAHLNLPTPKMIPLLLYTMRQGYFELFKALADSPEVRGRLHLDYVVTLLDELKTKNWNSRSQYTPYVNQLFSPEARVLYDQGLRGSDGSTFWDKIPISAF